MAIVWNQRSMATGIPEVDQQHQELIRHFNEFHDAMMHRKGDTVAIETLAFLADYTEMHFRHEEQCMKRYHCPAAERNLAAHNSLRMELSRVRGRIKDAKLTVTDLIGLEKTLGDWILNHICSVDIELRGCVGPDGQPKA